jgi:hypothetical protein
MIALVPRKGRDGGSIPRRLSRVLVEHGGTLHKFFSDQFKALWNDASARPLE